jgi:hypothetical protein
MFNTVFDKKNAVSIQLSSRRNLKQTAIEIKEEPQMHHPTGFIALTLLQQKNSYNVQQLNKLSQKFNIYFSL